MPLNKIGDILQKWTPHALIAGGLAAGVAFIVGRFLEPVTITFTTINVRDIELKSAGAAPLADKLFGSLVGQFGASPLGGMIMMGIGFAVMVLLGALVYEMFNLNFGNTIFFKLATVFLIGAFIGTLIMYPALSVFSLPLLIALGIYSLILSLILTEFVYKLTEMKAPPI